MIIFILFAISLYLPLCSKALEDLLEDLGANMDQVDIITAIAIPRPTPVVQ